jgi:ABC-type multidrug transport system ATPase subunit
MQSGHAVETGVPVLAAGAGVRHGPGQALRSASFRLDPSDLGGADLGRCALGIAASRQEAAVLIDLLSGRMSPDYGILHVLGQDMTTTTGRAAVRDRIGIARRGARYRPGARIQGVVGHAAKLACQPGDDRHLLVAAILDRLTLTPWAGVPVRSAPDPVVRRTAIAVAAVHQPDLLLIDGMLDDLSPRDLAVMTDVIGDLRRDAALLITGSDIGALAQACSEVLVLADGIVIGSRPRGSPPAEQRFTRRPAYCD